MAPVLIVLLLGAGMLSLFVLANAMVVRWLRRSPAPPWPHKVLGGATAFGGIFLGGLAALVLFVGTLGLALGTWVLERGPVRAVEVLRLDGPREPGMEASLEQRAAHEAYLARADGLDPRYPVHVLVEYRGEPRVDRIARWIRRETHGEVELLETRPVEDVPGLVRLDFGLDVSHRELARLEREFEEGQPFFDLPHALRIDVREP